MHKITAKFFNVVFHPLCMITYIMILFLYFNNFFNFIFRNDIKMLVIGFVLITTAIIPFMCYAIIKYSKIIDLNFNARLKRILALLFVSAFIFFTARSLTKINMPYIIIRFLYFNVALILITLAFTFINYAAIGVGELIGLYSCWLRYMVADNIYILGILLLVFAIIGYSQIYLKKTKPLSFCLETLIGAFFAIFIFLF